MKFNTRYLALVALVAFSAQNAMAMEFHTKPQPCTNENFTSGIKKELWFTSTKVLLSLYNDFINKNRIFFDPLTTLANPQACKDIEKQAYRTELFNRWLLPAKAALIIEAYPYHITVLLGLVTAALGTIDYKLAKASSLKSYLTGHRNLLLKNRTSTAAKVIGQLTRLAALSTVGMAGYSLANTGWNAFNFYALSNCWNCHTNAKLTKEHTYCVVCRCTANCKSCCGHKFINTEFGWILVPTNGCPKHTCHESNCIKPTRPGQPTCFDHIATEQI